LRVANSVAYASPGQPVVDVRSAVMRVGFATIRALAVNVALQQLSQMKELAPVAGQAGEVLRHSIDVAALASVIARNMTKTNPDEALFAGLVHDLGRFYMLSRVARYPGLEASSAEFAALADEWHAAVGHAILASLDVPEEIADAVNRHEDAEFSAVPQTLADILNVANRASHGPNPLNALTPDELPVTVDPQVLATLDAAAGPLQALAASLRS
jgi:putative nucleotidyltransferase with HDIG domain